MAALLESTVIPIINMLAPVVEGVVTEENKGGVVVTNDYNLNRVASVQSVPVLNINDLAFSLKTMEDAKSEKTELETENGGQYV